MSPRVLTPTEALALADHDPHGLALELPTFGLQFGLTDGEVLGELQSGALVACLAVDPASVSGMDRWNAAVVTYHYVEAWLASGRPAARKAMAHMRAPDPERMQ